MINDRLRRGFVLLVMACLAGTAVAQVRTCELPERIRFAMIPFGDVETNLKRYQPLLKRIEKITGRQITVLRPGSYAAVVEGLLGGHIDIAELGPATYVDAKRDDEEITPFATIEKRAGAFMPGGGHYKAMLVVLASSPHRNIASLKGSRLALTDPASTSGSLLPRKQFVPLLGVPLEKYFAHISFTGSHSRSIQALDRGEIDAAFVSSAQLDEANASGKLAASKVRVLWASAAIPYDPFVYRGQLCETLRTQISSAFLGEAAAVSLRELLDGLNATRFVAVDDSHYAGIRSLFEKADK